MRWLACALLLCACAKKEGTAVAPAPDDPTAIAVDSSRAVVKAGAINGGADATYVLIDAENRSKEDRQVTVEGALDTGTALHGSELRVPAGAKRTFVLIASTHDAGAKGASVRVTHAAGLDYADPVAIEEEKATHVGDKLVATAWARNTVEREANVTVMATFYDKSGAILSRPFTSAVLAPKERRPLRFEGPAEAETAMIFVGEAAFP